MGSLSCNTEENTLRGLFEFFGELISASIINDKISGQSKGFAFVKFGDSDAAEKTIVELNGKEVDGRNLVVNEARPSAKREDGFGGRGGFGNQGDRRY